MPFIFSDDLLVKLDKLQEIQELIGLFLFFLYDRSIQFQPEKLELQIFLAPQTS